MKRTATLLFTLTLVLIGCEQQEPSLTEADAPASAAVAAVEVQPRFAAPAAAGAKTADGDVSAYLAAINEELAARGAGIAVHSAEWIAPGTAEHASGQTVFANDRTKTLSYLWVPNDPRRPTEGNRLTYAVFSPLARANGSIGAEPILDAGYAAWVDETECNDLQLDKQPVPPGVLPSAILAAPGLVSDPDVADITEVGFLPGALFELVLGEGASAFVLGVTFSFVYADPVTGEYTDIDGDGNLDRAHSEIWYNDDFSWSATGAGGIDILTVAMHEQGHALGLGHFGKIFVTVKNGKLHVAPRALMNAAYMGVYRQIRGTDNAAHCEIYASWPN